MSHLQSCRSPPAIQREHSGVPWMQNCIARCLLPSPLSPCSLCCAPSRPDLYCRCSSLVQPTTPAAFCPSPPRPQPHHSTALLPPLALQATIARASELFQIGMMICDNFSTIADAQCFSAGASACVSFPVGHPRSLSSHDPTDHKAPSRPGRRTPDLTFAKSIISGFPYGFSWLCLPTPFTAPTSGWHSPPLPLSLCFSPKKWPRASLFISLCLHFQSTGGAPSA